MTKRIAMSQATEPQLRAYAGTILGLDLSACHTKADIKAKMAEVGFGDSAFDLPEEVDPSPVAQPTEPPAGKEMVKINIHVSERDGGDKPVPVGVNGRMMLIPRGQDVSVPKAYLEVLRNAVEWVYESGENGVRKPRAAHSYPFSVVG